MQGTRTSIPFLSLTHTHPHISIFVGTFLDIIAYQPPSPTIPTNPDPDPNLKVTWTSKPRLNPPTVRGSCEEQPKRPHFAGRMSILKLIM